MARPKLSNISLAALQAELQRRTKSLNELIAKRDALNVQIAALEGLEGEKAPKAPAKGKKRGPKAKKRATGKPLVEFVKDVLATAKKEMSIKDIEEAVKTAGYPTKAKTLYTPIFTALNKNKDVFKKVSKGKYALAGKKAVKAKAKKTEGTPF